jgi:hypothetical protein
MKRLTYLLLVFILIQCKGQNVSSERLFISSLNLPYDTIFEFSDTLSFTKIKEVNKLNDFLTNCKISEISLESYGKQIKDDKLVRFSGYDLTVNYQENCIITKDKGNNILHIQYGSSDPSINYDPKINNGYGVDYIFDKKGRLVFLSCGSLITSPDKTRIIQENSEYYLNDKGQVIKKTYTLTDQEHKPVNSGNYKFIRHDFIVFKSADDFLNYYKIETDKK